MKYDLWKTEREQATVMDSPNCRVLISDHHTVCVLKIWKPKAMKPHINYAFKTREQLQKCLFNEIEAMKASERSKEQYKQDRKVTPEKLSLVKVGDIYHASWGYDQTNNDYYQIVDIRGSIAILRPIGSFGVPGSEGFMSCKVMAEKDKFIGDPIRSRIQFRGNAPHFTINSHYAKLWDGKPDYESWYA
jgi:hypothetical protein